MPKNERFLPIEKREPAEDFYEDFEPEELEEIFDFSKKKPSQKKKGHYLYIAS